MAMDKGKKEACKAAGLTLPGQLFKGDSNTMLRARMLADGCAFDGRDGVWVFPDGVVLEQYKAIRAPKAPKAVAAPAAPAAPRATAQLPLPPAVPPAPLPSAAPPAPAQGASEAKLLDFIPYSTKVQQDKAEGPVQPSLFDASERNPDGSLKLLRIQPCKYVVVNVPLYGPRKTTQRKQKREKGKSVQYRGVEAVKIHTESDQLIICPEEHGRAKELQGKLGGRLRRLGTCVVDGLVAIPLTSLPEYEKAKADAKAQAMAFNTSTKFWKVIINCIELELVKRTEEEELARLAAYEIQRIMDDMKQALESMSPERIQAAATAAKAKAAALAPGIPQGTLYAAVDSSRKARSTIIREVQQRGRSIEEVRNEIDLSAVESARFAFLEFSTPREVNVMLTADTALPPDAVEDSRFANLERK